MLGIGAVIGTGIFVLTAVAAQKAGPGMMLSFCIAGFVCAVAALCYSELASMVPVAGSAYTYTYAVMGEMLAWMVGWALILEYALGASAVAVGWSNYVVGALADNGIHFPALLSNADGLMAKVALAFGSKATPDLLTASREGGLINLPAVVVVLAVTALLIIGTTESATVNAALVVVKLVALTVFIILTLAGDARQPTSIRSRRRAGAIFQAAPATSAPRPRSSSPMSASTRFRPPPRKPSIRSATSRSA